MEKTRVPEPQNSSAGERLRFVCFLFTTILAQSHWREMKIVFLKANVGSDSTGITEPSVTPTTNRSLGSALCDIIPVALRGEEGSSGHKESVTFDETARVGISKQLERHI